MGLKEQSDPAGWINLEGASPRCYELRSKQITGDEQGGQGIYLTLKGNHNTGQGLIVQRYHYKGKSGKLVAGRPTIAYGVDQAERLAKDILALVEFARAEGLKEIL